MSDIRIRRPHQLPRAKARREAERVAEDLRVRFDLEYAWDGDTIRFRRHGVTGHLAVTAEHVELEAKLGMLLAFLKPTIESHIHARLDDVFGAAATRATPAPAKKTATRPASPAPAPRRGK